MPEGYSFEKPPIPKEESGEEKLEKKIDELPEREPEEEGKEEKLELSPEVREKAEEFDRELDETIGGQLRAGELTSEQADKILEWAKGLELEQKAEAMERLEEEEEREKEMTLQEQKEKKETTEELQESISKYEAAIDNLVERAKALGIKISAEQLKSTLEMFRNIEPEPGEKMEWAEDLEILLENLSKRIEALEQSKGAEGAAPEKEKETKKTEKDLAKLMENMTAKLVEYLVRLTVRIAMGVVKGLVGAFGRKKAETGREK